jgi:hypothetical protein
MGNFIVLLHLHIIVTVVSYLQVSQQIIFAKGMYEEKIRTLALLSDLED